MITQRDNTTLFSWKSCGRGRDSATLECFGRGSQGTIFVWSSKLSLFFPELCSFRRVSFVSRAFIRFGTIHSSSGALGFDVVLELFLKTPLRNQSFFANSDYDHKYFLKISFLFPKQSRCYFHDSSGWAKHFGDGTSKTTTLAKKKKKKRPLGLCIKSEHCSYHAK